MYLTWPALCGCFAMLARRQMEPEQEKLPQGQCVLAALLVFLLVCRFWCVLVTGWKPANVATANLKQITAGPAAGTWADEKAADMQMALYEALEPFAGKQVLQAIGEQHGLGFMMAGGTLTIGQASVISGPASIKIRASIPHQFYNSVNSGAFVGAPSSGATAGPRGA